MKVQILQENLNRGLAIASRLISTKAQLPILANVLLKTDKNRLLLSATNLENGISLWLGAKVEKEGEITIPARILGEVISSLPPEKIDLEVKENILFLSSGGFSAKFNGIPATEFPKQPQYTQDSLIQLPPDKFLFTVNQVAFAAATDEGRPVLTGVLIKIKERSLSMVATDGYRLSLRTIEIDSPIKEEISLILPAKTLMEVAKIISEEKQESLSVRMGYTKEQNQVVFVFPDLEFYSRVIEGEFPDYEKIIPKNSAGKVTLDKENFNRSVKIISVFARESSNIVKLKITKNLLEMSANSPQVGENINVLEVKTEGDGLEIAFNFRFLQGFLNAVLGQEITMETTGSLNPGVFKEVGNDNFLHLIMPVRLQTEEK